MNAHPPRILIIDDDPHLLTTLRDILNAKGYETVSALTGHAALAGLEDAPIHVALIDLRLEDMSGLDVLRGIKARRPDIECILLTGHASQHSAIEALQMGAYGYFQKPFDIEQVLLSIQHAVEKRKTEQALVDHELFITGVLNSLTAQIAVLDEQGVIVTVNAAWEKFAAENGGRDPLSFVGINYLSICETAERNGDQSAKKVFQGLQAVLNGSETQYVEEYPCHSPTEKRWFTVSVLPQHEPRKGLVVIHQNVTEQKLAEEALRLSEERHRMISGLMSDYVYAGWGFPDGSAKTEWISGAFEQITGYSLQEIQALPAGFASLLDREDSESILPKVVGPQSAQGMQILEYRIRCKNGETRWLRDHSKPILEESTTQIRRVVGAVQDITKQKQAEEALRESELRYRTLTEQIPAIVYLEDATIKVGHTLYISPQVQTILGISPTDWLEDALDMWVNHIHDEDRAQITAEYEKCFDSGTPFDAEYRMVASDGRIVWIHDQAKVILSESGQPRLIHGIMYDITERKLAEMSRRENEEKYKSLYQMMRLMTDNVPDLIWAKDMVGHFTFVNQAMIEKLLIATDTDEPIGKTDMYFAERQRTSHANDPNWHTFGEICIDSDSVIQQTKQVGRFEEFGNVKGEFLFLDVYKAPIWDLQGNMLGTVGSGRDVTREKGLEREQKKAEEALRQHVANLETLNRISMAVRAAMNPQEVLATILEETLTALNTPHGAVHLWNETSGHLHKMIGRGWPDEITGPPCKPGEGVLGRVFLSGKTYLTRELIHDPWTDADMRQQLPPGWGGACIPIHSANQTLGVMFIAIPTTRKFSKDEIRLLNTLAEMTGATLHRMRLHEETVRHLNYLQALHTIDQAITASFDLRPILSTVLTNTITQLHVDAADVLLYSPRLQTLEYAAGTGFFAPLVRASRIRISEDFAGRVVTERRLLHLSNPVLDREKSSFAALWASEGFHSYFGVPLIVKGEIKGVLELFHRAPLPNKPEWLDYLNSLALQTAIAIDNSQLFENLQQVNLELRVAYDATIEGWSRAMDMRDSETEGHTQRVTDMALSLAKSFGLTQDEMLHMHRGALLHDIGKIGVADHILLKPGPLTEEETNRMRQHPQLAYQMLFPISYLRQALDIPYCHHEKWDGTGYPRGLVGEQIPLTARIFSVVDVYDALTSNRPYRQAWSREKTLAYLREQSGKHFDPKIVDVFFKFLYTR